VRGEVSRGASLALAVALVLLAGPAAAQSCPDCLTAGAARVSLAVPAGAPLAGYGSVARRMLVPDVLGRHAHAFWFKPFDGERDTLATRALVLQSGDARVAWVAIDLLAVDRSFTAEVERRLAAGGTRPVTLIVSASHTHSGPGAFVDSAVLGWLALDRLDSAVREALVTAVVAAVQQADAVQKPARVGAGSVTAPRVVASRLDGPVDPEMLVLKVTTARGAPLALVWNYAIHGTALGARNLRLSGDVMGEASRRLERQLGAPALFVNGAVGDVSPARHGERATTDIGAELAESASAGWARAEAVTGSTLGTGQLKVSLPSPSLSLRNCLRGWMPASFGLPLGSIFPRETALTAVVLGDVGWVTFPGELQTRLGLGVKQAASARLRRALVAGVSNDYLGYFLATTDYQRPSYISCSTIYGPNAGTCLAEAAGTLLGAVARGERPAASASCDR
jgi:Neutral/alkaline non-lysosomal ceramidase, N-terminal